MPQVTIHIHVNAAVTVQRMLSLTLLHCKASGDVQGAGSM